MPPPGGSLGGIGAGTCAGTDPGWPGVGSARAVPILDEEHIGMSLFQRAHDILQAKANKALERRREA